MPISVDELSISIEAKAQSANTAIDRLVDKLDRLSGSLGRLNTTNLNTLAMGVNRLGTAVQTMNGVKTADFTRLAKNLERLNLIDVSNLSSISASVNHMATAFKGLENISQTAGQLGELANGIRQLGYKSADKAIENIPKLAVAMKDLMKTLSGAPKVSQNLIEMTNALAKLARTGASSGKAATSLSRSLNTYTKSTTKATSGTKGLASAIGKLYATYWLFFRAFGKLGDAIDISSKLTEVQNVVDVTFGKYADMVEKMSDTSITDFGMSELTVKQISSRFQAMGTAMGFAQGQMADMSIELTKLTADMASFYNMEQEDVAKDLESVFTGMTRPLRTYGLDLTEATLKEWALRNGMNANIDAMSQMEKTMLRYQYVMANTGAAQGDFARTVNTWANQTRILKQNLEALASVIGGTLINALKPLVKALNAAMSHIIAFAETISNALGKIFGWTFEKSGGGIAQDFDDAAIGAEDIADSTGTAAKNIQKMKAGLRAFDELKTINLPESTDPTGGGGSGAGGAGDGAIAAGGQWAKVDSLFDTYKSEIDTLFELGAYISKTLIDAMESIDWDAIYEKARGFGKGLADFLNGLFADQNGITLFGEIGKTIAKALNTVIYSALSFGETFDFEQFGRNIADGINNFFQNFDFGALAENLNVWVDGLVDAIKTALEEIDWKSVFGGIFDFALNLDFDTAAILAIFAAPTLIKGLTNLISLFGNLEGIVSSIGAVIGGLSTPVLAAVAAVAALATGLGYVFATNEEVRESFSQAISAIQEGFQPAIEFVVGTLLPDLQAGWQRILEILTPLGEFLQTAFTSIWQDMINPALTYIGETVLPLVAGAFENLWNNVLVPLGEFIGSVLEPVIKIVSDALSILWKNVVQPLASAIGNVLGKAFEGLVEIFNETVVPILNKVISVFQFLWNNVLEPIISFLWSKLKPVFETVFKAIGGIIDGLGKTFGGLIDFIVGVFTLNWEKAWNGVKDVFKGIFNGLISIVEGVVNLIIGGLNGFLGKFDGIVTSIGDVIGIDISIPVIPEVSIPRFEVGGFVPKRYSMFMAGENGVPEMLGTVGGQTAVAGGAEITGIRDAVLSSHREEMELMRQQNELLRGILAKEFGITEQQIGKAAQNYSRDYMRRTGNPAYSF